jgi:ribosome-associated toxin RatA of RatAB toxin-antitoxin module
MPVVRVEETLQSNIEDVWKTLRDVERYPALMEPVRSLRVFERGPSATISDWEVVLRGSILKWRERAEFFPDEYRIQYNQLEGDLEWMKGFWKLRALSATMTEAILEIDFEIGIPILQDMLNPIAERALSYNARLMLRSLNTSTCSEELIFDAAASKAQRKVLQ